MKVQTISLHQPWASLIAQGVKVHETRSWPTQYRGPLLIHAAKRWTPELRAYHWQWRDILGEARGAHHVGAPHERERLYLLAYPHGIHGAARLGIRAQREAGSQLHQKDTLRAQAERWLDDVTSNAGSGTGVANRMDRVTAIGNGQVPAVAALAFNILLNS